MTCSDLNLIHRGVKAHCPRRCYYRCVAHHIKAVAAVLSLLSLSLSIGTEENNLKCYQMTRSKPQPGSPNVAVCQQHSYMYAMRHLRAAALLSSLPSLKTGRREWDAETCQCHIPDPHPAYRIRQPLVQQHPARSALHITLKLLHSFPCCSASRLAVRQQL